MHFDCECKRCYVSFVGFVATCVEIRQKRMAKIVPLVSNTIYVELSLYLSLNKK